MRSVRMGYRGLPEAERAVNFILSGPWGTTVEWVRVRGQGGKWGGRGRCL